MLRNVLVTLLKVIGFFLALLTLGCGLGAAGSVLWIVFSLILAVLELIGFDWSGDFETALIGLYVLLINAAGCVVSYKIGDWLDALAKRIELRSSTTSGTRPRPTNVGCL